MARGTQRPLVAGIDAGGSKTLALVADADTGETVARGDGGPANPRVIGFDACQDALAGAIQAALATLGITWSPGNKSPLSAVCMAVAGAGRPEEKAILEAWARKTLARSVSLVHDALPLLAVGTPSGWGVALIAGTGSLAYGQDNRSQSTRAGGWGYLFGDEGSGYAIALASLRAITHAADGRGPPTKLTDAFLKMLNMTEPMQLVALLDDALWTRARIADLSQIATACAARGDAVAGEIIDRAAADLAAMVGAVAKRLGWETESFPLAVGGSLMVHSTGLRRGVEKRLRQAGFNLSHVTPVPEPAQGAVRLAVELYQNPASS